MSIRNSNEINDIFSELLKRCHTNGLSFFRQGTQTAVKVTIQGGSSFSYLEELEFQHCKELLVFFQL